MQPGRDALGAVAGLIGVLLVAVPAAAQVRITSVEPARSGTALTCVVRTAGLPDGPAVETLASGLPSSLTLAFGLVDASGRERGGPRVEVRIEPDSWERGFRIRWPGYEQRAGDVAEVGRQLERLGPFTIASLDRSGSRRLQVRARIALHALAPAETDQARALFSGDMGAGGSERREVSAGLGTLLRFFLGRGPTERWSATATSAPFDTGAPPSGP